MCVRVITIIIACANLELLGADTGYWKGGGGGGAPGN